MADFSETIKLILIMVNWDRLNSKTQAYLQKNRLTPGSLYRAVTSDGDIYDGVLTFVSDRTVELQSGNSFKSFCRSRTKLVRILYLDCE